jgi:SAM-dependent methyltransferase
MNAGQSAQQYDAWYRTPRGRWIGEIEYRLLFALLAPERGASVLDVGCGTGYFTRRFAREAGLRAIGLDRDRERLVLARSLAGAAESYVEGEAVSLPFADASFDFAISVAALCFVADPRRALAEMVRVTRRRFALGLLNRRSLLYWKKGRGGGQGGYRGARWHAPGEIPELFEGLPVADVAVRTAIFLPGGGALARLFERCAAPTLRWGGFIAVGGAVTGRPRQ